MILARVERNAQAQIHTIEKEKFDLKVNYSYFLFKIYIAQS